MGLFGKKKVGPTPTLPSEDREVVDPQLWDSYLRQKGEVREAQKGLESWTKSLAMESAKLQGIVDYLTQSYHLNEGDRVLEKDGVIVRIRREGGDAGG